MNGTNTNGGLRIMELKNKIHILENMELVTIIDKNRGIGISIALDPNFSVVHSELLSARDFGGGFDE